MRKDVYGKDQSIELAFSAGQVSSDEGREDEIRLVVKEECITIPKYTPVQSII